MSSGTSEKKVPPPPPPDEVDMEIADKPGVSESIAKNGGGSGLSNGTVANAAGSGSATSNSPSPAPRRKPPVGGVAMPIANLAASGGVKAARSRALSAAAANKPAPPPGSPKSAGGAGGRERSRTASVGSGGAGGASKPAPPPGAPSSLASDTIVEEKKPPPPSDPKPAPPPGSPKPGPPPPSEGPVSPQKEQKQPPPPPPPVSDDEVLRLLETSKAAIEHGDSERALALVEQAASSKPDAHYLRARCLSKLNRAQDALAALKAAVKAGYSDVKQARKDPDLAALRLVPDWENVFQETGAGGESSTPRLLAAVGSRMARNSFTKKMKRASQKLFSRSSESGDSLLGGGESEAAARRRRAEERRAMDKLRRELLPSGPEAERYKELMRRRYAEQQAENEALRMQLLEQRLLTRRLSWDGGSRVAAVEDGANGGETEGSPVRQTPIRSENYWNVTEALREAADREKSSKGDVNLSEDDMEEDDDPEKTGAIIIPMRPTMAGDLSPRGPAAAAAKRRGRGAPPPILPMDPGDKRAGNRPAPKLPGMGPGAPPSEGLMKQARDKARERRRSMKPGAAPPSGGGGTASRSSLGASSSSATSKSEARGASVDTSGRGSLAGSGRTASVKSPAPGDVRADSPAVDGKKKPPSAPPDPSAGEKARSPPPLPPLGGGAAELVNAAAAAAPPPTPALPESIDAEKKKAAEAAIAAVSDKAVADALRSLDGDSGDSSADKAKTGKSSRPGGKAKKDKDKDKDKQKDKSKAKDKVKTLKAGIPVPDSKPEWIHSGWLVKKGKKRWYALTNDSQLQWFREDQTSLEWKPDRMRGSAHLSTNRVTVFLSDSRKRDSFVLKYVINQSAPGSGDVESATLHASSEAEAKKWLDILTSSGAERGVDLTPKDDTLARPDPLAKVLADAPVAHSDPLASSAKIPKVDLVYGRLPPAAHTHEIAMDRAAKVARDGETTLPSGEILPPQDSSEYARIIVPETPPDSPREEDVSQAAKTANAAMAAVTRAAGGGGASMLKNLPEASGGSDTPEKAAHRRSRVLGAAPDFPAGRPSRPAAANAANGPGRFRAGRGGRGRAGGPARRGGPGRPGGRGGTPGRAHPPGNAPARGSPASSNVPLNYTKMPTDDEMKNVAAGGGPDNVYAAPPADIWVQNQNGAGAGGGVAAAAAKFGGSEYGATPPAAKPGSELNYGSSPFVPSSGQYGSAPAPAASSNYTAGPAPSQLYGNGPAAAAGNYGATPPAAAPGSEFNYGSSLPALATAGGHYGSGPSVGPGSDGVYSPGPAPAAGGNYGAGPPAAGGHYGAGPPAAGGHYGAGPPAAAGHYGAGPPAAAGQYGAGPPAAGGHYGAGPPAAGQYGAGPPAAAGQYGAGPPAAAGGQYGAGPPAAAGQYGAGPPGVSYGNALPASAAAYGSNALPASAAAYGSTPGAGGSSYASAAARGGASGREGLYGGGRPRVLGSAPDAQEVGRSKKPTRPQGPTVLSGNALAAASVAKSRAMSASGPAPEINMAVDNLPPPPGRPGGGGRGWGGAAAGRRGGGNPVGRAAQRFGGGGAGRGFRGGGARGPGRAPSGGRGGGGGAGNDGPAPFSPEAQQAIAAAQEKLAKVSGEAQGAAQALAHLTSRLQAEYGASWQRPTKASDQEALVKAEALNRRLQKKVAPAQRAVEEAVQAAEAAAEQAEIDRKARIQAKLKAKMQR